MPDPDVSRVPPHDEDAERALLAHLILAAPKTFPLCEKVRLADDDFYVNAHRTLYAALKAVYRRFGDVDPKALKDELGAALASVGGVDAIEKIVLTVDSPTMGGYYAERVADFAVKREAAITASLIDSAARNGVGRAELVEQFDRASKHIRSLCALPADAPAVSLTAEEILALVDPDITQHLWAGVCAPGILTLLAGYPGAGKSWLTHAFVGCASRGARWLGHDPATVRVVYLSEESPRTLKKKIRRFGIDPKNVRFCTRAQFPAEWGWEEIAAAVTSLAVSFKAALLVIDTCSEWFGLAQDGEKDEGPVRVGLAPLQRAAHVEGLAVLAVHHMGKADQDQGKSIRGSSAWKQVPDIVVELRPFGGEDSSQREIRVVKDRLESEVGSMIVEHSPGEAGQPDTFRVVGTKKEAAASAAVEKVYGFLQENPGVWFTKKSLRKNGMPQSSTLATALGILVRGDRIWQKTLEGKSHQKVWAQKGTPGDAPISEANGEDGDEP